MAQRMAYHCDCCNCLINAEEHPIVIYVVAGHVNGGGEVDESKLHPWVAELLRQPVARREFCAECFDEAMHAAFKETHAGGGEGCLAPEAPAAA